jgi:hypothetical protein
MGRSDTSVEGHHGRLVELIRAAHGDGVEITGWIAGALGDVAQALPGGAASLLARRPGSWEADLVRRLVNGTIGWPGDRPW